MIKRNKKDLTILAVDDSRDMLALYSGLLDPGANAKLPCTLYTAENIEEAWRIFYDVKPDVLILDIFIGKESGLDFCKKIREKDRDGGYIGIILVTSEEDPTLIAKGLDLGADDFCVKSNTTMELMARLRSVVRFKRYADSLTETNNKLRNANEKLLKISITDELTHLFNMRYFKKRYQQEFIRSQRYHKKLSIIMMDLDHFKSVNDQCDHLMGSYVLATVGILIAKSIRSLDIAARYGGDEFIIMLPETGSEGAYVLAQRIQKTIHAFHFTQGDHELKITTSLGIATQNESNASIFKEASDLIRKADQNLYQAKKNGRGIIV